MRAVKLRWGCGPAVLLKVFTRRLDIARKDLGQVLVQMRAHDDPQAVDLLGDPEASHKPTEPNLAPALCEPARSLAALEIALERSPSSRGACRCGPVAERMPDRLALRIAAG